MYVYGHVCRAKLRGEVCNDVKTVYNALITHKHTDIIVVIVNY